MLPAMALACLPDLLLVDLSTQQVLRARDGALEPFTTSWDTLSTSKVNL